MDDIGILTFHRADNYGSVLQTYALQTYLKKKFGLRAEIVDYAPECQEEFYRLFVPVKTPQNLVGNILKLTIAYKFWKRKKSIQRFRNSLLNVSQKKYATIQDFEGVKKLYKCIITGSDQIWNTQCADFSWVYFLENINGVNKISYSASLGGGALSESDKVRIKQCLQSYTYISVREQYGASLLESLLDNSKKVEVCVDPTLLLDIEDYDKIASKRLIRGDYIFLYSVYHDDQLLKTIRTLRKRWNLPIITLISRNNSYKVLFNGIQLASKEGPEDFLSYIKYAKFVLTNSFHGSVFSIIYKKEFHYLGDYKKDPRLRQLLTMTKTTGNATDYQDLIKDSEYFGTMEGKDLSQDISILRKTSEQFLRDSLKEYIGR